MSKSAEDKIFEGMWKRIGDGLDLDDPLVDEDKLKKFTDLKYRIESLTTIISAYKDIDVGTVLNPEEVPNLGKKLASGSLSEVRSLFQTPSFSMGLTAFYTVARALRHSPSLVSLGGTIARKNEREEFFEQPETWQALLANGDDFVKFLDVNKEFAAKLLSKSTGLDPKIEEGKELPENMRARVVSENVIPLIRNIIQAAKNDHVALGAAVSGVIMPLVKPEKGKALDVSKLLTKAAELKIGALHEILSSPENTEHLRKIAARSYDIEQENAKQQKAKVEAAEKARARIDELRSEDLSAIMASPAKVGLEASKRIAEAEEVGKKVDPRDVLIAQVAEHLPTIKVLAARDRMVEAEAKKEAPAPADVALAATLNLDTQISQTLDNGIISRAQIEKLEPLTRAILSSVSGTDNVGKILAIGAKITKPEPEVDFGEVISVIESTLIKSPEVKKAIVDTEALSVFFEIAKAAIKKPLPPLTQEKLDLGLDYGSRVLTLLKDNPEIVSEVAKIGAGALLPSDDKAKTRDGIVKLVGETIPVLSALVENIKEPELSGKLLEVIESGRGIKEVGKSIEDLKKAAETAKKEPDEKMLKVLEAQKADKTKEVVKKAISLVKAEKSFAQEKLPALIKGNHDTVVALLKPAIDKVPELKGTTEKLTTMLEDPKILTQAVDIADNYVSGNKFKAVMQGVALFATSKKVRSFVGSVVFNAVKEKFSSKPKEVGNTEPAKKAANSETPVVEQAIAQSPAKDQVIATPAPEVSDKVAQTPVTPAVVQESVPVSEKPPATKRSAGVGPKEVTTYREKHPPRKRGESFAEAVKAEPPSAARIKGG